MRNYQVQKAVQLLKDYKFQKHIVLYAEMLLLAFISCASCSVLTLPYTCIFVFLCLVISISGSMRTLARASANKMNLIMLALLLVDMPTVYLVKCGGYFREEESMLVDIVGFLANTPSYVEFYLKIVLFLLQCQKIHYSYDHYQHTYEQIRAAHSDHPSLQRLFRKSASFAFRVFKPLSVFMSSSIALIFAILHPSILLFCLMPLFIYGFFMSQPEFKTPAKLLVIIVAFYLMASYVFSLLYLLLSDTQQKENATIAIEKLLGFKRDPTIFAKLFPDQFNFFFLFVLAFFVNFINRKTKPLVTMINAGYGTTDDEFMSIIDDSSEVRSKLSCRTPNPLQNEGQ